MRTTVVVVAVVAVVATRTLVIYLSRIENNEVYTRHLSKVAAAASQPASQRSVFALARTIRITCATYKCVHQNVSCSKLHFLGTRVCARVCLHAVRVICGGVLAAVALAGLSRSCARERISAGGRFITRLSRGRGPSDSADHIVCTSMRDCVYAFVLCAAHADGRAPRMPKRRRRGVATGKRIAHTHRHNNYIHGTA